MGTEHVLCTIFTCCIFECITCIDMFTRRVVSSLSGTWTCFLACMWWSLSPHRRRSGRRQFVCIWFGVGLVKLEQLNLKCVTVLPHALVGLKKLKYLQFLCKYKALDKLHYEHIESFSPWNEVALLPLSNKYYTNLKCIKILTSYDGLDLSLFENVNSIKMSNKVKVLPQWPLINNKQNLSHIGLSF